LVPTTAGLAATRSISIAAVPPRLVLLSAEGFEVSRGRHAAVRARVPTRPDAPSEVL